MHEQLKEAVLAAARRQREIWDELRGKGLSVDDALNDEDYMNATGFTEDADRALLKAEQGEPA